VLLLLLVVVVVVVVAGRAQSIFYSSAFSYAQGFLRGKIYSIRQKIRNAQHIFSEKNGIT
jgi:hypothetical protein